MTHIPFPHHQLLARARAALTRYGARLVTAARTCWEHHQDWLSHNPVYREVITALAEALLGREREAYRILARLIATLLIQHHPGDAQDDWEYAT